MTKEQLDKLEEAIKAIYPNNNALGNEELVITAYYHGEELYLSVDEHKKMTLKD